MDQQRRGTESRVITDGKKKESWLFWKTKTVSRLPESVSLEMAVSPK
jgi:hypothetical protein